MTDIRTEEVKKELKHKRAKSWANKVVGFIMVVVGLGLQVLPYLHSFIPRVSPVPKELTDQFYVPLLVVFIGWAIYVTPRKVADSFGSVLEWIKSFKK